MSDLVRYIAAEAFLASGVVQFVCWRSSREPIALRTAVAMATVGLLLPILAIPTPWAPSDPRELAHLALCRTLTFLAVVAVYVLSAARARARAAERHGVGVCAALLGAGLTCLALFVVDLGPNVLPTAGEVGLTVGWAFLAVLCLRSGSATGRAWALATAILAAGELLRAVALAGPHWLFDLGPAFDLIAALALVTTGVLRLRTIWRTERAHARNVDDALTAACDDLGRSRRAEQQRLHDARSAILGVIGASELLVDDGTPVGWDDRKRLASLMAVELSRLESLLDGTPAPDVTFDLAEVLTPVLNAHRLSGAGIDHDLQSVTMVGRPDQLATVLDSLMRNARVHTGNSRVTVRTRCQGSRALITVEDDGPGIAPEDRASVLGRGVRGPDAGPGGSGLGLYNAASAVAEQGGSLTLSESAAGGLRVTVAVPIKAPAEPEAAMAG